MTAEQQAEQFAALGIAVPHGDYAHGIECLWHGPVERALTHVCESDEQTARLCPVCSSPLRVVSGDAFWSEVRVANRNIRDLEAMLRWSAGKCFPDYATLEDAWRQASTE